MVKRDIIQAFLRVTCRQKASNDVLNYLTVNNLQTYSNEGKPSKTDHE